MQLFAVASQKFTCPGLTAVTPAFTVAVRVTTLPVVTDVTAVPPEVILRFVVVAGFVWPNPFILAKHSPANTTQRPTHPFEGLTMIEIQANNDEPQRIRSPHSAVRDRHQGPIRPQTCGTKGILHNCPVSSPSENRVKNNTIWAAHGSETRPKLLLHRERCYPLAQGFSANREPTTTSSRSMTLHNSAHTLYLRARHSFSAKRPMRRSRDGRPSGTTSAQTVKEWDLLVEVSGGSSGGRVRRRDRAPA